MRVYNISMAKTTNERLVAVCAGCLVGLGVLVASLSYTAWGWFEIATVKDATLP